MRKETFMFAASGGMSLPAVLWLPDQPPKLLVQIAHGMTEHIGRYAALAEYLTGHGIAVGGFDLRGHGQNPGSTDVASFGEGGWEASLEDMRLFFQHLHSALPGIPHCMLGFSLGSFLLREYLGRYPQDVAAAAICGTGHQPGAVLSAMMAIVHGQIKKAGFNASTPLVQQLSFGTYNQKFKPARTVADWLCADGDQLDAYLADPLCRESISAGLFWQMLGAMRRTGNRAAYEHWNKATPILLLSGQDDPVGSAGKGVRTVQQQMEKAGLQSVTLELLPGARHDIFHEEACGAAQSARKLLCSFLLECNK